MTNRQLAEKYYDYMVAARRHIHENPELTGKEFQTVQFIMEELKKTGLEPIEVENGGVLCYVNGPKPGKLVLLRADCDALPVVETENLAGNRQVWSKNPGVMHACGHDCHTATLLGAAKILKERQEDIEGSVLLYFERGEEGGGNFQNVLDYMDENGIVPDTCFGMHVRESLETGKISVNDKLVDAAAVAFKIRIEGSGGHGSRPDLCNAPMDCFVAIYHRLQELRNARINPYETLTFSIGLVQYGHAGNIIPQELTFTGTARTHYPETAGLIFKNELIKIVDSMCEAYGCTPHYDMMMGPAYANTNDTATARFAREVFAKELGEDNVVQVEPNMSGESFAVYNRRWHGAFAGLGIQNEAKGSGAVLHACNFDVDEEAMITGAACHATFAIEWLKAHGA